MMISDAELIIMQTLWEEGALTAKQIIDKIPNNHWNDKTTRTFINRLVEKGVVSKENGAEGLIFQAILSKEEFYRHSNQSFLKKMYQGSLKNMLLNFIEDEPLTSEEIQEIQEMLEKKYDEGYFNKTIYCLYFYSYHDILFSSIFKKTMADDYLYSIFHVFDSYPSISIAC